MSESIYIIRAGFNQFRSKQSGWFDMYQICTPLVRHRTPRHTHDLLYVALLTFLHRYDNFHPLGNRIYRVTTQVYDNIENPRYASAPVGIAQKLQQHIPGVEKSIRRNGSLGGNAIYHEKHTGLYGCFADPEFLRTE